MNVVELSIEGNDRQKTREGKNLYNAYDIGDGDKGNGATIDNQDYITLQCDNTSGTSVKYTNYLTSANNVIKANTKYFGVLEVKEISGTGTLCVTSQIGTNSQTNAYLLYDFANLSNNKKIKFNFTTIDDISVCYNFLRTFLKSDIGQSGSITFRISVFENEPNLDTFVYEPYGAMPSPLYPSEVETVGDNVNLFDITTIKENKYINGNIDAYGNLGDSDFTNTSDYIRVKAGRTYNLSYEYEELTNTSKRGYCFYGINKKIIIPATNTLYDVTQTNTEITVLQDGYIRFSYDKNVKNIKFVEEIQSCNIVICDNNLYNNKDMYDINPTIEYLEDDYLKCTYNNTSGSSNVFKNFFTNASKLIKPNKDYWVILEIKEVIGTGKIQTLSNASVVQFNNWQDYNFSSLTEGKILIRKVTSGANSNNSSMLLRSYCQFAAGESGSITFRISISPIEVTAENFKYVPFSVQTKTVDIQQEMLQGDYFVKEEDGWKEVHGWGKYTFTGNESFSLGNTYQDKYRRFSMAYNASLNVKASWNEIGAKSNYFTGIANTNYETAQNNVWINEQSRFNIGIDIAYLTEDSANGLKAWLAQKYTEGNSVYVWYKLATPTRLACTEKQVQQLEDLLNTSTYKNVTHIYSTDKVSPVIKVVYRKDIETMFNQIYKNLI